MNFFKNATTSKKWMATAGLVWLLYLVFYLLSLMNFHSGKVAFNDFYQWFAQTPVYNFMIVLLVATLSFHVIVAVSRQLKNNVSAGTRYKKTYPKAIPKVIAWGGVSILFAFIIFHFIQMTWLIDKADLYQSIVLMFSNPLMWLIYGLGLFALGAHLHHGLTNVLQTFGLSSKQHHGVAIAIVLVVIGSFFSIPVSVIL
jgi:succinate dehydrogenase / fumarate reductase cytochrome b subunit